MLNIEIYHRIESPRDSHILQKELENFSCWTTIILTKLSILVSAR